MSKLRQWLTIIVGTLVAVAIGIVGFLAGGKWGKKPITPVTPPPIVIPSVPSAPQGPKLPDPPKVVDPLPGAAAAPLEQAHSEDRKERAKENDDILRRLLTGGLIVFMAFGFMTFGVMAAAPAPVAEKSIETLAASPYIPKTYDELLTYYKQLLSLALDYRKLYQEAEASNDGLQKANTELRSMVEERDKYEKALLDQLTSYEAEVRKYQLEVSQYQTEMEGQLQALLSQYQEMLKERETKRNSLLVGATWTPSGLGALIGLTIPF